MVHLIDRLVREGLAEVDASRRDVQPLALTHWCPACGAFVAGHDGLREVSTDAV